ncbi:neural proliferation differentiation and control protein 1a [Periophthalmus magnuspinnatus]|uniref:neural proliferation differentiation and control protein 1a n=1 Tax=Periophthalmus magnuspinnatus TaxID=409849 RepID=UPI00145A2E4B|nr:neural proliferation differentiation and control protein 1a [Periophthalmus magnuspinnatus]
MLLLSNPRWASAGRASLLLVAAVLLHVTSASLEAVPRCPSRIDCAKAGRHFCRTGSSKCGPCLYALEENDEELCVPRKKHHQKHVKGYPDLDEEIDYLHSVIEKQQVSEVRQEQKQSNHFAAISIESNIRTTQPHPPPAPKEKISKVQTFTKTPVDGTTAQPTTRPTKPTGVEPRLDPVIVTPNTRSDQIVIILVSVCVVGGTVAVILSAVCAVKLRRDSRLTEKVDYPAFGGATVAPVNGNGPAPLDHTLAQNAQMFHYQHQKQQMLSMGKQKPEAKAVDTDVTSDEEEVGGDFTVYECPGLAPTGEMEVKNPLFDDSSLPYQGNHK